jgi:glyoxylate reductase
MKHASVRPRILVARRIPENGIEILRQHFTVDLNDTDKDLSPRALLKRLDGAFGVIAMMANRFDRQFISKLDTVEVISNYAVGFNNVDISAATEKGIVVTNTPGVLTDATADLAFGLLLAAARRIAEGDRFVRAHKFKGWAPTLMLGYDVSGKTMGIIGAGRIGAAVAARARGFGMRILYNSHKRNADIDAIGGTPAELRRLLEESDYISLNVPLTGETRGMIGKRELALMKPTAVLVNTARGEVVDENALISALKRRKIAGAGLDVYVNEPKINPELLKLDNVVLSPHLGSSTLGTRAKMSELAALNAVAVLKGEHPPSSVNPVSDQAGMVEDDPYPRKFAFATTTRLPVRM